ncbi:hypothetical protein ACHAQA_004867 [Verticillium albo-atrum]
MTDTSRDTPRYDIVIVGAGPVGLMLSTCLARWGYKIKHIDNRPEPTKTGRADGIQPRSLDLLRNMGLKTPIMAHKPARVFEVAFWDPVPRGDGIARTGTWASCPSFIDARYPFTTLLHQGHIEQVFISDLAKNNVSIQRPWTIKSFTSDVAQDPDYPVEVRLEHEDGGASETVRAKYLFGGEGARSFIRNQLNIGIKHKDPIEHVWGVMDGVVRTDFPDIKMKCTIHSPHGSIMVIPREDNMVRLYIQIASSTDADWNPRKTATEEEVQASAKRIFQPYNLEWERVEWYSVYPIGQGIANRYTLDHRVFLGGDACHTHSPKAGQGMNTAFLDAQNLAWKIHLVEAGFAHRNLLATYESERKHVAEALLDFDNKYAKLFSQRPEAATEAQAASRDGKADAGDNEFIRAFKESCEFTSGYGVAYKPNALNWSPEHPAQSSLINPQGSKLRTGRLLINANVTRVVDANVVHLEQEVPMNGSFRIFVFAGNPSTTKRALNDLASGLQAKHSFYAANLRSDIDTVSYHETHNPHSLFFTLCTIFAATRSSIEIARDVPKLLARYRDHVYADDVWDRRVPDAKAAAHAKLGLDEEKGGVVVVRPDGYVGVVVSLTEGPGTADALNEYFGAFEDELRKKRLFALGFPLLGVRDRSTQWKPINTNFARLSDPTTAIFPQTWKPYPNNPLLLYNPVEFACRADPLRGCFIPKRHSWMLTTRYGGLEAFKWRKWELHKQKEYQAAKEEADAHHGYAHVSGSKYPKPRLVIQPTTFALFANNEPIHDRRPAILAESRSVGFAIGDAILARERQRTGASITPSPPSRKRKAESAEPDLVIPVSDHASVWSTANYARPAARPGDAKICIKDQHAGSLTAKGTQASGYRGDNFSHLKLENFVTLVLPITHAASIIEHLYSARVLERAKHYNQKPQARVRYDLESEDDKLSMELAINLLKNFPPDLRPILNVWHVDGPMLKTVCEDLKALLEKRPVPSLVINGSLDTFSRWERMAHLPEDADVVMTDISDITTPEPARLAIPGSFPEEENNCDTDKEPECHDPEPDIDHSVAQIRKADPMDDRLPTYHETIPFDLIEAHFVDPRRADAYNETITPDGAQKRPMRSILKDKLKSLHSPTPKRLQQALHMKKSVHFTPTQSPRTRYENHNHALDHPIYWPKSPTSPPSTPPAARASTKRSSRSPTQRIRAARIFHRTATASRTITSLDSISRSRHDAGHYNVSAGGGRDADDAAAPNDDAVKNNSCVNQGPENSSVHSASIIHEDAMAVPRAKSAVGMNLIGEDGSTNTHDTISPGSSPQGYGDMQKMHRYYDSDENESQQDREQDVLSRHGPSIKGHMHEGLSKYYTNSTQSLETILDDKLSGLQINEDKQLDLDDITLRRQVEEEQREAAAKAAAQARADAEKKRADEELMRRTGGLRAPRQKMVAPLSNEWLQRVKASITRQGAGVARTSDGTELTPRDFAKVVPPTEWLNDEIVNGTLLWLDRFVNNAAGVSDMKSTDRKCLVLSSFIWKRINDAGPKSTGRALRRLGVTKDNFGGLDTVLLPVCESLHWTLIVVRPKMRTIAHMDSLNPAGTTPKIRLAQAWVKATLEENFVQEEWKVVRHESPHQTNGYDCGVHTITNGICIALGLNPIDAYASEEMPLQRLRIAAMLLNEGFSKDFDLGGL